MLTFESFVAMKINYFFYYILKSDLSYNWSVLIKVDYDVQYVKMCSRLILFFLLVECPILIRVCFLAPLFNDNDEEK